MSEVKLRTYCEELEDLIEKGSLDAAISHCQHILKVHPKCLKAYRLIGKAALEKNELEAAGDLFNRVLSIDPEDFIARVGLNIVSDKKGDLEQAVWHMERAFELAPDNQAIIDELRHLYGRRDGLEPDQVPLTQGALARLYARGNLHAQAINAFRQLLESEPDRVDLQVALAETLWQADQRIDAAETSLAILEKLPYCLKANLILGEIWSSSGRMEEGAAHLKRAQMIDPENEVAQILFGERSPLPPAEARIGRMEYVAPPAPVEQEPDWLAAIVEEGAGLAQTEEAVPDWLQAVAASADTEITPEPETASIEADQVPDWLQAVAATAEAEVEEFATEPETTAEPSSESEMPEWLTGLTAEKASEPLILEEAPDTLEAMAPPSPEEPEVAPGEMPDWLAEMAPSEAEAPVLEEPEVAPGEMPDWLAEMAPSEAEAPVPEEPEIAPGEMPDWLAEMAPLEGRAPAPEESELTPAEIPDWLAEMAPAEAVPPTVTEMDLPPADVPDWLAEAAPSAGETSIEEAVEEEVEIPPPPLVAAETPDWLTELVEAAGSSMEDLSTEQPAELEEERIPDWLTEPVEEQMPGTQVTTIPAATEEPEEEQPIYPEEAVGEVAPSEAELLARIDEMSPEEAFAAWEAMLAEGPAEETPAPAAVTPAPEEAEAAGPIVIEEPEKEKLVYPEGAGGEVTPSEAELLARIDEMSPEEAFAAWEAMLAEGPAEEAPAPAAVTPAPEEALPAAPVVMEEPEAPEPIEAEIEPALAPEATIEREHTWVALTEEEGLEEITTPAIAEEAPPFEPITDFDQAWMALSEDETAAEVTPPPIAEHALPVEREPELDQAWLEVSEEAVVAEVTAPPIAEEALPAEPVAEPEQAWMALAEDEGQAPVAPVEAPAQPAPAEPVTAEEITAEAEIRPEEEAAAFPTWAVAEAAEMVLETGLDLEEQPTTMGPDWVLLADAEKAEIRTFEELEPVALPDLVPAERERIEEEIVSVAEVAPAEPEPPARPTWVALEEQPAPPAPAIKERVAEAKRRVTADKEDDLARLELARGLWAAGQRNQAYTEYEQLIKSPLLDDVVADLEKITVDEPLEEPALRLLGDAYMRDDRLDESLVAYRRALASL